MSFQEQVMTTTDATLVAVPRVGPRPIGGSLLTLRQFHHESIVERPFEQDPLVGLGERHPDVAVTVEVTEADPKDAITTASRNAALLVLGSRGRGRLASGLFGSVSRHLIRRSTCPVVIARPAIMEARLGAWP